MKNSNFHIISKLFSQNFNFLWQKRETVIIFSRKWNRFLYLMENNGQDNLSESKILKVCFENELLWNPLDIVYRGIFTPCYFCFSTLADGFSPFWIRPDTVVLKERYEKKQFRSLLNSLGDNEGERDKNKTGAKFSLYTVCGGEFSWIANISQFCWDVISWI